jgi:inner membrane protein
METHPDQQEQNNPKVLLVRAENNFWETNRLLIKGIIIGILILVMMIPSAVIFNLVQERAERQQQVINEVSSKWAEPQTIVGPVLMVPYNKYSTDGKGQTTSSRNMAYFLPDKLDIKGGLTPETRHRSIYDVILYQSDITLNGSFDKLNLAVLNIGAENVLWNEARLVMGLSDARGLEDEVLLQWNNNSQKLDAGVPENDVLLSGLQAAVACNAESSGNFSIRLKVKGSAYFYLTPLGKSTTVKLNSAWQNPAFDGKYLPNSTADISDKGFNATWKIQQASRSYPQQWTNTNQKLSESAFGVRLLQPTDTYAKTERSVKYALLFIGLTFAVFFFIELLQKKQIHPLQYLLVGIALTVFYTLLLSFSEYIGFNKAYAIAAVATITLIGLYVWSMFKQGKIAIGFTLALGSLYAYIFFLIQLQDYALLFGSVGLFVVVALAMYSSRKVDWYHVGKKPAPQPS